jgi:hypothetical protein
MPIFLGTKSEEELAILRGIKASFDPDNIMNPGKVLGETSRERSVGRRINSGQHTAKEGSDGE